MQGHKGVIIIGAIVVLAAGVGIWWWLHQAQSASAAATVPSTPSPAPGAGPAPISVPAPAPITLLPVAAPGPVNTLTSAAPSPVASVAGNMAVPYDPRMDQVQSWANGALDQANLAQYNGQKGNFTQADWDGLFDLVINRFMGGQPNTPARIAFWNSWRTTYHINDGTYP